jgi:hypothetical protein
MRPEDRDAAYMHLGGVTLPPIPPDPEPEP